MKPSQLLFFREFLGSFFESIFLHGLIDSTTHTRLSRWCQTAEAKEYATRLFREGTVDLPEYLLTLKLVQLREMDGKEFDHIQIIFISTSERPRTNCFVGHKFSPQVDKTLRWNLRQILEPYNVELEWSGRDLRSVQILDNIVRQIKTADFCVFDNRATKGRPNVYIEAGICIALEKPFVLFEREPGLRDSDDPGPIPSDLTSALALRYKNYRQLFRDFYFRLPLFFQNNLRRGLKQAWRGPVL
jgi:hypothetical protein